MEPIQSHQDATAIHRLVQPFVRTETARWRERDEIRNAIDDLYQSLATAAGCLEMDDKLQDRLEEASRELRDAETAIGRLWPCSAIDMRRLMECLPADVRKKLSLHDIKRVCDNYRKAPCGECHLQPGETCDICCATEKCNKEISEGVRGQGLCVAVGDGKYTVKQDASGRLTAMRYGEPWRDCCGDGLIYALATEVETLRGKLELVTHNETSPRQ